MHKRMNDDRMGYSIDLSNGLTVSVQWHGMAYANIVGDEPVSVEIACYMTDSHVWMTRKVWVTEGDAASLNHRQQLIEPLPVDDVIGWVPVSDVAKYIDIAKNWREK